MRKISWHCLCGLLCALFALPVAAQNFPEKPITLVVPYTAGGATDVAMRALADAMGRQLGQRVIVENRTGAAGTLGPSTMVNAKANPGKVSYSTPGHGTSLHITMEEIARREGIQWLQVPYKGAADALIALRGGHVTAMADSTTWGEMVDAGQLRLLSTWGENRTRRWPNVPTLKDLGYGIVSNSPYGIAGPKGMDPKIVKILHDAIRKAMDDPAYQKVLERLDQDNVYKSSEDYAKYARQLNDEEKAVVERMGLKM